MKRIAYSNPFVPPELVAACGLHPWPVVPVATGTEDGLLPRTGVCPYVRAFVAEAMNAANTAAIILTTTCDQMRRAGDIIRLSSDIPLFILNVPRTWQTPASRQLYRRELERLCGFLGDIGGAEFTRHRLIQTMLAYDNQRLQFARPAPPAANQHERIPLALVGGPLRHTDKAVFDAVQQAGGTIVIDATESGRRTLPAPFDRGMMPEDPLGELVRAYFDTIPDVFRRPNSMLYEWLRDAIARRGVRGLIVHRYLWCDMWLAEVGRIGEAVGVPVLDLEAPDSTGNGNLARSTRIQAFLEALR